MEPDILPPRYAEGDVVVSLGAQAHVEGGTYMGEIKAAVGGELRCLVLLLFPLLHSPGNLSLQQDEHLRVFLALHQHLLLQNILLFRFQFGEDTCGAKPRPFLFAVAFKITLGIGGYVLQRIQRDNALHFPRFRPFRERNLRGPLGDLPAVGEQQRP